MAHFCKDCGHEYDDAALKATSASERRCPVCGSGRVSVYVKAGAAVARAVVPAPSILLTASLWIAWLSIAIERAQAARRVRGEMVSLRDQGGNAADLLSGEFEASIVALAASAHALDALYGSTVVPQSVRDQWRNSSSGREGHIREALKCVFNTGKVNTPWVTEFGWLFDLRDFAVHPPEEAEPPEPHPVVGNTSAVYVRYSCESADRAASFALSVFRWCVDNPRQTIPGAMEWATQMRPIVEQLEARWRGRTP